MDHHRGNGLARPNSPPQGMTITFLGTAASEGYPVPFCRCQNCQRAFQLGGPNLRHRSAALIDGQLLIDLGPDVMAASLALGIPLTDVRYALLTHEHADHLEPSILTSRSPSAQTDAPPMALYATAGALQTAVGEIGECLTPDGALDPVTAQRLNLSACPIAPGETFHAGPYRITAIPAQHDSRLVPLLYAIEKDGRALFYATDTGPLPTEAWEALAAWNGRFNLVALDHTFGFKERSRGHNNAEQFVETIAQLRASGLLADDCRVFAHHLAHHSNPDHETLARYAADRGYDVAYDGLTVQV